MREALKALIIALLLIPVARAASYQPVIIPQAEPQGWVKIISETGFPIAVSVYLLWMIDKRLVQIMQILARLTEIIGYKPRTEDDQK